MMQPAVISILTDRIREARKAKGFSQDQLAERVGLTRVTISQIENGRRKSIKPQTLRKLAEALEKPEVYFYREVMLPPDSLPDSLRGVMTRLLALPRPQQEKLGHIFEQIVDLYEVK
jgi:transcriptional regulator with XRE-family HTH domain